MTAEAQAYGLKPDLPFCRMSSRLGRFVALANLAIDAGVARRQSWHRLLGTVGEAMKGLVQKTPLAVALRRLECRSSPTAKMRRLAHNRVNHWLFAAVACCVLWPAACFAFGVSLAKGATGAVVRWKTPAMTFWLHPACSADLPVPVCLDEVRKSFTTWSNFACTSATFQELGLSDSLKLTPLGYNTDGKNQVAWVESSAWDMGKYVLGVTSPVFYEDGTIIEADIAMNGYLQTWSTSGKVNSTDVRNVVVHEIGHYFGAQHTLGGYDPDNPPTMAPTADPTMKSQTPEADDVAGLCFLYPKTPNVCQTNKDCPLIVADGAQGEYYAGQLACQAGKCGGFDPNVPKGTGKLGATCATTLDCIDALFCQQMQSGKGVCAQTCKPNTGGACPSGFACVAYSGDPANGVCLAGDAPGTKSEGAACNSGKECASGLCLIDDAGAVCRTQCTASKPCAAGKVCAPIPGVSYGACIEAKKPAGGACSSAGQCASSLCAAGSCAAPCAGIADCPAGQGCQAQPGGAGACVPLGSKGEGAVCGGSLECKSGLCADLGKGFVCGKLCSATLACYADQQCAPLTGGGGVCVATPKKAADGAACQNSSDCVSNLCVGVGSTALCTAACAPSKPCASGYDCVPLQGGGGACLKAATKKPAGQPCQFSSDCQSNICISVSATAGQCADDCSVTLQCPAGFVCEKLQSAKSACFALGPAQVGDKCASGTDCQSATCLKDGSSGYCSKACAAVVDCPCGMTCVAVTGGKACAKGAKVACVPTGAACAQTAECAGGACIGGTCIELCSVFAASACAGGLKCLRLQPGGSEGVCGKVGVAANGTACGKDADCASGLCHAGQCATPCSPSSANKCGVGMQCQVATGALGVCAKVPPPVVADAGAVELVDAGAAAELAAGDGLPTSTDGADEGADGGDPATDWALAEDTAGRAPLGVEDAVGGTTPPVATNNAAAAVGCVAGPLPAGGAWPWLAGAAVVVVGIRRRRHSRGSPPEAVANR